MFVSVIAAALVAAAAPAATPPGAPDHRCGAGARHAIIAKKHACLKAGVRCTRRYDAQYHRYGFHCHGARLTRRVAPAPLPPPPNADLALVVTDAPDPARVGEDVVFTLSITNAGPDRAARVVAGTEQLADEINGGSVQFVGAEGPCTASFGVLACVFTDVAVGATVTARIVLRPLAAMTLSAPWAAGPSDALRTQDTNIANNAVDVTTTVG